VGISAIAAVYGACGILHYYAQSSRANATIAQSQDNLAKLAAEAMEEYHAGQTEALDPDQL